MAQGFAAILDPKLLTVIINVGDDDYMYGAYVSADLDTVTYTLAGIAGPHGWGIENDTLVVMDHLESTGVDTAFRLGDRDLAYCLARTEALRRGSSLSEITRNLTETLGIKPRLLPATDDVLRTKLRTEDGEWIAFQEYFVSRGHRDTVAEVSYEGAEDATPGPGVIPAIEGADLVVIAPSNPPLSIWPILAIDGIASAIRAHPRVVAVSPFFGGSALRGPAAEVMESLGLPAGTEGVLAAYDGLIDPVVVDQGDESDAKRLADRGVRILVADTRIAEQGDSARLASQIIEWTR